MSDESRALEALGARVRRLRADRGLTAREVARRAGLSLRFYGLLEQGHANIAYSRLLGVARALEVPAARLVEDAGASAGPLAARPVVGLLGLRGAGKSSVGPLLAARTGAAFVELDDRIEELAGMSVPEVFALHGEEWYRRLATSALKDLIQRGAPCVVALPGGIVHDEEARQLLRERCVTAWLRATPQQHMARVLRQGDRRPMADRSDAMGELRALLQAREPWYRQADVVVDTSRRNAEDGASAVAASLQRLGWAPAGRARA